MSEYVAKQTPLEPLATQAFLNAFLNVADTAPGLATQILMDHIQTRAAEAPSLLQDEFRMVVRNIACALGYDAYLQSEDERFALTDDLPNIAAAIDNVRRTIEVMSTPEA